MADEKHLLLTISGGYTDSTLSGEIWQVGLRLALVYGTVDDVGTLPNTWAPKATSISRTETNWTITGNWFAEQVPGDPFAVDDWLNDTVAPAVATWQATSPVATHCRVDSLKVYPIGSPLGRAVPAPPYAAGSPISLDWTSSHPVGGNANPLLPLQNALVLSHRTTQVGRHGRGRMYRAGLTTGAIGSDSLITSTVRTAQVNAQVALLEAIATGSGLTGVWNVRPCVTGAPYVNYALISQVIVDDVMDTQRRRTKQLTRTPTSAAVSY